jgi:hypothetical protein
MVGSMNVMAAPNRSVITARTGRVEVVEGQPKWYLTVEVLGAEAIEGGLFVRAGDVARVFVVGDKPPLRNGDVFRAEVEYIGGPGGGELQLLRLDEVRPRDLDS